MRDTDGKFSEGNPGRPKGARHKTTLAVEVLLEGEAEGLTRKAIELALEGDVTALRLCLERIAPVRKDAPIQFTAPKMETAADAPQAMGAILDAVAAGDVTPSEGSSLSSLIDGFRRTLETAELEERITALEKAKLHNCKDASPNWEVALARIGSRSLCGASWHRAPADQR